MVYNERNMEKKFFPPKLEDLNLRLSIGGFKSSPVKSIYVTANEPSFYIRRIKIALTFATKLKKKQSRSINIETHYSDNKNISNKSFQYNKIIDKDTSYYFLLKIESIMFLIIYIYDIVSI
jgi:predicted nucleotidyltransferase